MKEMVLNQKQKLIVKEVCEEYGVAIGELNTCRQIRVNKVKRILSKAFYLMGYSYPTIGLMLGVDHTTVLHNVRVCGQYADLNEAAIDIAYMYSGSLENILNRKSEAYSKTIELENNRKIIKDKLNEGESVSNIAKEINKSEDFVKIQIDYFKSLGMKKLVPNYKTGLLETKYIACHKPSPKTITIKM